MSINFSVSEVNSSCIADSGYDLYLVDCTDNDVVITLDAEYLGKAYWFIRVDSNAGNTLTVDGDGVDINEAATVVLSAPTDRLNIVKTSSQWVTLC